MTGPEHYAAAEEALAVLDEEREPDAWIEALKTGELALAVQAAQVHATLALAAAAALHGASVNTTGDWAPVAGTERRP